MTPYKMYQIDAFTGNIFGGNPAAVMPLQEFFSDQMMQDIAQENNLAETAFVVPRSDKGYDLRWFTPNAEIEFCGHATIATAHVLIHELGHTSPLVFHTQIGELTVEYTSQGYVLCAPNYVSHSMDIDAKLARVFGNNIQSAHRAGNNVYVEFETSNDVKNFAPDMGAITAYLQEMSKDAFMGVSIMSEGDGAFSKYDFISRHFAPLHGVPEDPVTGSVHSAMAPYWAKRLGRNGADKTEMTAFQCSKRGGVLHLRVSPENVYITGQAVTYLKGEVFLAP